MRLEQHIYTSGKKGFATVAQTPGITKDEQIKLENHSLYILPGSFLYKEGVSTPTKYIFYPLSEKRFVLGRAIYIGKDNLGRPGNYLFHNLIISKDELEEPSFNPAKLIKMIEENGLFRTSPPEKPLDVINLPLDKEIEFKIPPIPQDLILALLYYCFSYKSLKAPLLLVGQDKDCLNFLGWLYTLLPYSLKENLSFDTYSYGANLGLKIMGIPKESDFYQTISYSLKIDLLTYDYNLNPEIKEPSKPILALTEMIATGREEEIASMYSAEYSLKMGDYERFRERYIAFSKDVKELIYTSHKERILNYIIDKKDLELLQIIINLLFEKAEDRKGFIAMLVGSIGGIKSKREEASKPKPSFFGRLLGERG
ncbi:MAG: hypothetical protein AB1414_14945 [bacterium]